MQRDLTTILAILVGLCFLPANTLWAGYLFKPQTYTHIAGKPNIYTDRLSNCEDQAVYKLVVENGDEDGHKRLSSAKILLNGVPILKPNDLNQKIGLIERDVLVEPENELEVRLASGPGGIIKVSIECTANCLEVRIDSPKSNAILNQKTGLVTGTVYSHSGEVGVTVNATFGEISGPPYEFAVPKVPLSLGTNTLTARATNRCGMKATASTQVDVESLSEPLVLISVSPSGVVAPVTVRFRALAIPPNPILNYTWNFTNQTGPEVSMTYETAGLYLPQVAVRDTKNNLYSATAVVTVLDPTRLDILLQSKWKKMRDALSEQDIEQALFYFTRGSRERYGQIFEEIQDELDEEAAGLQDIAFLSFSGNTAKYRIQQDVSVDGEIQTLTYWVYFVRDADGIWRIKQF